MFLKVRMEQGIERAHRFKYIYVGGRVVAPGLIIYIMYAVLGCRLPPDLEKLDIAFISGRRDEIQPEQECGQ
jgi:hypothetical protein